MSFLLIVSDMTEESMLGAPTAHEKDRNDNYTKANIRSRGQVVLI